jgi:hypothetical protein
MWNGRPALYDAIEFDEAIATIDTLYDLAFLLMDLDSNNQRPGGEYPPQPVPVAEAKTLSISADSSLLPLFLALRAAVRAMVTAGSARDRKAVKRARPILRKHATICGLPSISSRRRLRSWSPWEAFREPERPRFAASLAPWLGRGARCHSPED